MQSSAVMYASPAANRVGGDDVHTPCQSAVSRTYAAHPFAEWTSVRAWQNVRFPQRTDRHPRSTVQWTHQTLRRTHLNPTPRATVPLRRGTTEGMARSAAARRAG